MRYGQKWAIEHVWYPAAERVWGNAERLYAEQLQQSQWLEPDKLRQQGQERLQRLLNLCREWVPAYRGLPYLFLGRQMEEQYQRLLPPLTRARFAREAARHARGGGRPGRCWEGNRGLLFTREQLERYQAARLRGLSWYGITPGSRCVVLWDGAMAAGSGWSGGGRWQEWLLGNRCRLPARMLAEGNIRRLTEFLNRYRPEYLYGSPASLVRLARRMEEEGAAFRPCLKAVICVGPQLDGDVEGYLRWRYACPVGQEYAPVQAGVLACRCPMGRLHITAEHCLMEVLDPHTLAPLRRGRPGCWR